MEYKKKTGRPCKYVEECRKSKSKSRGELVVLYTRVSPRAYEWLKDQSERRCVSMGQVIDDVLFAYNCHEWKKR